MPRDTGWQDRVPAALRGRPDPALLLTDTERTGNARTDLARATARQRSAQIQWCRSEGIALVLFDRWHRFVTDAYPEGRGVGGSVLFAPIR